MFHFFRDRKMEEQINAHDVRIAGLEEHKRLCDKMHEESAEHRKRSDDAINKLTDSNFVLAKSINEINITITEALPTLNRSKNGFTTIDNLKSCALWFAAIGGGFAGMAALFKFFAG